MSSIALVFSLALAAPVQQAHQHPAPAAPAEKKICRKAEAQIGTRLSGKRICLTQAEWNARSEEARRNVKDQRVRSDSQ